MLFHLQYDCTYCSSLRSVYDKSSQSYDHAVMFVSTHLPTKYRDPLPTRNSDLLQSTTSPAILARSVYEKTVSQGSGCIFLSVEIWAEKRSRGKHGDCI